MLASTVVALTACGDASREVALTDVVGAWEEDFTVRAFKTEPTFVEQLIYGRKGDVFALDATSSDGDLAHVVLVVDQAGAITPLHCSRGTDCSGPWSTGFLSTVAALAAHRAGRLDGDGEVVQFAGREAVCIPAEQLGARTPPLDPCFDRRTGAVLAHRHRSDGSFDGPTPDPESVRVSEAADPALFDQTEPSGGSP